jgi:D-3-phosphoglycerate dehydrogenase / 2-oxoglutarate reductase
MSEKIKTAITIRSFDLKSEAFATLSSKTAIVYTNTSGKRLAEKDLCAAIKEAECVIAGTEVFSAAVLSSARHLKVISRVGIGLDNIDLEYAHQRGITVLNTPHAPVAAVAEHTVALILSLFKNVPQYYQRIHQGDYSIQQGSMVRGKNLGIIGLGKIGRAVATLAENMGLKIMYFDPWAQDPIPAAWERKTDLNDLLHDADIISLHAPPQSQNRPVLDANAFSVCKKGVVIINTARASLVDENALVDSLDQGIVAAAGLDVVSTEPYRGALLNYPQIIITPHVASNTVESRQQMEIEAVENMLNTFGI